MINSHEFIVPLLVDFFKDLMLIYSFPIEKWCLECNKFMHIPISSNHNQIRLNDSYSRTLIKKRDGLMFKVNLTMEYMVLISVSFDKYLHFRPYMTNVLSGGYDQ